jgi:hypothetical protein
MIIHIDCKHTAATMSMLIRIIIAIFGYHSPFDLQNLSGNANASSAGRKNNTMQIWNKRFIAVIGTPQKA